jgi:hypothetical protein
MMGYHVIVSAYGFWLPNDLADHGAIRRVISALEIWKSSENTRKDGVQKDRVR